MRYQRIDRPDGFEVVGNDVLHGYYEYEYEQTAGTGGSSEVGSRITKSKDGEMEKDFFFRVARGVRKIIITIFAQFSQEKVGLASIFPPDFCVPTLYVLL